MKSKNDLLSYENINQCNNSNKDIWCCIPVWALKEFQPQPGESFQACRMASWSGLGSEWSKLPFRERLSDEAKKSCDFFYYSHSVWKSFKVSHLILLVFAISVNFCPIKIDLSGNTVWPQALGFQNLVKIDYLWHF